MSIMWRLSDDMKRMLEILVLALTIVASAAVAITLTHFPCYATICSEDYFVSETRLHISVYYGFLATTGSFLSLHAFVPAIRSLAGHHLLHRLPLLGRTVTLGGLLTGVWILGLVGAPTVFWLPEQERFWGRRADPLDWVSAKVQLTITGVTGHYADILLGLLVIPVSRNSLFGHAFSMHRSTLLFAHKMVSYLFSAAVFAHGCTYIAYATDPTSEGDEAREEAFATGNPAMTLSESKQRSEWFTQTTYTGAAAFISLIAILLTSVPWVRRNHYNFFYYSHVINGTMILIGSCLHASTDFYFLIPGVLLWMVDWGRRLFFGDMGGLASKTTATIENAGHGWVRISLPTAKKRGPEEATTILEKGSTPEGGQPLVYYYLNFPAVSKYQNHAFTAAIPSSRTAGATFLLQRSSVRKSQKALDKEWTWKVGALVPDPCMSVSLEARVEGSYPIHDNGFKSASHVVCIVGGTGVTGALSLAHWWLESRCAASETQFTLLWSVRYRESTFVREWAELEEKARSIPSLHVAAHVSSELGRMNPMCGIRQALCSRTAVESPNSIETEAWVYSSGPDSLLIASQHACVEVRKDMRKARDESTRTPWAVKDVSWHMARWEL